MPAVVDPEDLVAVLDRHGVHLALDQTHDVGQVILTGLVLIFQLGQRRPELAAAEDIYAGVDFANALLFADGIFLLDDVSHGAVARPDDAAVATRIFQVGSQQRDGGARLLVLGEQGGQGLAAK